MVWEWKPGLGFVEAACSLLLGHKYSVTCVRFSPKGCLLVSSSADGYSLLWDIKTGQCIHSFVQSNGNGVRTCCFSTDGALLATAGEGGILCLWEISSHNLIGTIDGHDEESIQGTSFTPDNMLIVSGDVMGTYRIWQVTSANNNDCSALTAVREAHDLGINALEFSSQYNSFTDIQGIIERSYLLVSCGNDHCVVLWQVSMRQQDKPQNTFVVHTPVALMTLQGHTSAVLSARFSPKGDMLASTSIDKTARIWEVSTGKCVKTLEGHDRYITCCAFSSNQSLLVTGSNDKSIWVWNLSSDFSVDTELGESSNGQRYWFQTSNGVSDGLCYESSAVKLNHKLEKHSGSINTCHFSTTHLATAGSDKLIYLWKWDATGVHLDNILEGHRYAINQTGEIVRSGFHISASGVRCVRFSPDWKLLATGGDDERASLFNVDSCELIA
ncbi:hypothetical protein AAG570_000327 [Ranatra chinensis]|uniref:Uncharacterized protein n=1 Tax=Ranatra chinensis TaxID=642074 RepID=A0ABD0YX20_9HEMI